MKEMKEQKMRDCCAGSKDTKTGKNKGYREGIIYGLIPHIGCIAFIVLTVIGTTTAAAFFRPLLMKSYLFYGLIALSLVFATISAAAYLRKNSSLSSSGIKRNWRYLSIMYGTTVLVNLILFMVVFPLAASMTAASQPSTSPSLGKLTLKVDIPCPGHAPLIIRELKDAEGVSSVSFRFPDHFEVIYDPSAISMQQMLSISIFSEYPAAIISGPAGVSGR